MELTSSALRGCIMAPEGKKLVVSELSNIEGRKLAWLTGKQWKLDAFQEYDEGTGPDLYKLVYASAFNIFADNFDNYQRQIGKVMELGPGFGGGVPGLRSGLRPRPRRTGECRAANHPSRCDPRGEKLVRRIGET